MKSTKFVKWMLSLAAISASPAMFAITYELTVPEAATGHVQVMPGQTGYFTFDIRNLSAEAGTAIATASFELLVVDYMLGPGLPAECGTPYNTTVTHISVPIKFPVALGPNAAIRCSYPVTRSASSNSDVQLSLCTGVNESGTENCSGTAKRLAMGTLPDIAIRTAHAVDLPLGSTETLIEVTARNLAAVAVNSLQLITECKGLPGSGVGFPYTLHVDFPGACPAANLSVGCQTGFGTPPPIYNWTINVPPIPALGESTCLVKMRFAQPLTLPIVDTLGLDRRSSSFPLITMNVVPPAAGRDVNASNDSGLPFGAIPLAATSVPLAGRYSMATLMLTLVALTGWHYRRRRLQV